LITSDKPGTRRTRGIRKAKRPAKKRVSVKRYAENAVVNQYMADVLCGKIITGKLQRLAVERHIKDLKTGYKRGLVFDSVAAQQSLDFMPHCRHSKGKWAGQPLELAGWQQFCQWCIYGWKRKTGRRRFTYVYVEVARKNGKSTWLSANGIKLAFFDGEKGAEVYTGATKFDQARIIHGESIRMVRKSPELSEFLTIHKNNISCPETESCYLPLGQDSDTLDGLNVHAALIDEFHAHKTVDLFSILDTGTGSREDPIMWIITTAGENQEYPCFEYRTLVEQILKGTIEDDSWFGFICCLDDGDKWTDKKNWIKANPNLGISVYQDGLDKQFEKALKIPSEQNKFLCKRLNRWVQQSKRWLSLETWDENKGQVNEKELIGRECIAGLDLASVSDMTALIMTFPEDPNLKILARFWIPEAKLEQRHKYLAQYQNWHRQGFLIATPGEALDYKFLIKDILELTQKFRFKELWMDILFQGHQIEQELREDHGINTMVGRMGMLSMSPPAKEIERRLLGRTLHHGGNPILRWMADCVTVRTDHAGNIMPDKGKSGGKIDGITALCLSLMGILRPQEENISSYSKTSELFFV